jgi:hypothetical protein
MLAFTFSRSRMSLGWSSLTFMPDEEAVKQLHASWYWLLPEPFEPVLFSVLGDVFFEREAGGVWWLNTGTAEVTRVADSMDHFRRQLGADLVDDWFMPGLVEELHSAGKVPGPGECFTFVALPIFAEGRYEVQNLNPVPARDHFALCGDLHREIRDLPDGAKVAIKIAP